MHNDNNLPTQPHLIIRHFTTPQDYTACFEAMKHFSNTRDEHTPDECWVLQHHDVLTQGQAGKAEHILSPTQLPVVQTDRGGQVTWHGKGQLVIYFLFDLNRLNWNVRTLVSFTEQLMIDLLKKYQIDAYAKPDAPGVYVDTRKIGSLGFKIRRGRSYHGLSLNIDCELDGFQIINPCGYAGLEMVRICDLIKPYPNFQQISADFTKYIQAKNYYNDVRVTTQ